MSAQLDPWADASTLAARLAVDDAKLVVIVGAEQWCARCRELRPFFDQLATRASLQEVWLWLDVEDHAEFLGDYLPEQLPVLFIYIGDRLTTTTPVHDVPDALALLAHSGENETRHVDMPSPGIRERLLIADWAPTINI